MVIHNNIELIFVFHVLNVIVKDNVPSGIHSTGPLRYHLGTKLTTITTLGGDDEAPAASTLGNIAHAGAWPVVVQEGGDSVGLGRCNESDGGKLRPAPTYVRQIPDMNPIIQVDGLAEGSRDADKH